MRGVLAVNWVAGLVVGNKAGKMYREPYNTLQIFKHLNSGTQV